MEHLFAITASFGYDPLGMKHPEIELRQQMTRNFLASHLTLGSRNRRSGG